MGFSDEEIWKKGEYYGIIGAWAAWAHYGLFFCLNGFRDCYRSLSPKDLMRAPAVLCETQNFEVRRTSKHEYWMETCGNNIENLGEWEWIYGRKLWNKIEGFKGSLIPCGKHTCALMWYARQLESLRTEISNASTNFVVVARGTPSKYQNRGF